MAQESVVDLLFNAIQKVDKMDWDLVYISAKKIEKEQMIDFAAEVSYGIGVSKDEMKKVAEQYYNETYNK
jgi:hypothetical protein